VNVRAVTAADEEALRALWEDFDREVPVDEGFAPESWEEAWVDLSRHAREGVALIAEDENGPAGFAFATALRGQRSHVTDIYVRPDARNRGLATELFRRLAAGMRELGAEWISLDVQTTNSPARMLYERLGFTDVSSRMATRLDTLEQRSGGGAAVEPSLAVIHVQTDDQAAVASAVERFVPRLYRSAATAVSAPHNGWIGVSDAAWDVDPQLAYQLAQELSHVTGSVVVELAVEQGRFVRLAAFERGSLLDEYLSVPDAYGELAPGDAIALRANPTVLGRLTGAEPGRIRSVARTAETPSELPPAPELAAELADTLGLAEPRTFADVAGDPGSRIVQH
jgi:ribosomal protein S18 acetylase RimI-like enzyme